MITFEPGTSGKVSVRYSLICARSQDALAAIGNRPFGEPLSYGRLGLGIQLKVVPYM